MMFRLISDAQFNALDDIILRHPGAGEIMINGHLRSRDVLVPRKRLRESLMRVDSDGRRQRRLVAINRRTYSCPSPNYVWHMDGTHKLVRWRFIFHVAIDGYSRLVTYCR